MELVLPEFLSGELFARFLGILAIDLILSGDNAVVIALAVRQLKGDTRRKAIVLGATGAVLLRLFSRPSSPSCSRYRSSWRWAALSCSGSPGN